MKIEEVKNEKTENSAGQNHEKLRTRRKHARNFEPFGRILNKIIFTLVLCALFAGGGYILAKKLLSAKIYKNVSLVTSQLRNCQELAVSKYEYSDIVSIKKTTVAGFAKSFSIVKYSGVIRAGIPDIAEAKIKLSPEKRQVHVKLPEIQVLSDGIVDMEVFDESRSIFIPISTQEIFDLINENRIQKELAVLNSGFLEESRARAVLLVENMLYALGFQNVEVE